MQIFRKLFGKFWFLGEVIAFLVSFEKCLQLISFKLIIDLISIIGLNVAAYKFIP